MINEQIDQIVESINEIKSENGEQWAIKQMEKTKLRLDESLKKLTDTVKDDAINFEELGIDCLFVDELCRALHNSSYAGYIFMLSILNKAYKFKCFYSRSSA